MQTTTSLIQALKPNGPGHQFVCYADSCSGIPNGSNEQTFSAVNQVISSLQPAPEFVCFPGDEIKGLQNDPIELQKQWRYWLDTEMAWLNPTTIPIYHTTGNHTAYDSMSNGVFREVLAHLPQNGPAGQKGLTYFVRKNDLLMVFVNTLNEELGGEGWVESEWLDVTLQDHADARHKLVIGHHPVHAVNGFSGPHQRTVEPECGCCFWDVLVKHKVLAYVCSHILAFDLQVHQGVLQILTGGAGTMPLSPQTEYFHCIQAALDANGLRYQVLDTSGQIREWLKWPLQLPPSADWEHMNGEAPSKLDQTQQSAQFTAFEISGFCSSDQNGTPQTFLCTDHNGSALSSIWVGLRGKQNQLCVLIIPEPGRSPRFWLGPQLKAGERFNIQLGLHSGMGPGGILWRWNENSPWSSLVGTTAWGVEKIEWPTQWYLGQDQYGEDSRPFRGANLAIKIHTQRLTLKI
ncbi:MAG: metallophosphoesterase [Anaerolineae bacterium]